MRVRVLNGKGGFDQIQVCTSYDVAGERTERFLPDGIDLAHATPVCKSLPGFTDEITTVRARRDLPPNAQRYVEFIEEFLGVRASIISVGPGREQTLLS